MTDCCSRSMRDTRMEQSSSQESLTSAVTSYSTEEPSTVLSSAYESPLMGSPTSTPHAMKVRKLTAHHEL